MQEINLLVEQKNGSIETNFEEIKAALAAGLEEYKGMVFTAESQPEAKKTVASLRKLKKAMNDRRIEIKKKFMEPYTNFEAQVKELDKLIDEPIDFISGQIEEFERRRVEAKKAMICEIYTGIMAEHGTVMEYLPLDRIYDSRWENSTTTQKAITEAITAHVEHVEKDLDTIRAMESEFEDKGLAKYKAMLELSDAITAMNQYQKQKEEILRRQAEEEQRKAEEEARRAAEEEQRKAALVHEEPVVPEVVPNVALEEEKEVRSATAPEGTVRYEVVADPFQIAQLEAAMREYGIKFRRV
jgi:hypothetical protein|nr:MAG TPA: Protein of unknown function (DUF1351) [Caudoviricetes sp.]